MRATLATLRRNHVRHLLISASGAADAVRTAHHVDGGTEGTRTWADQWGTVFWTLVPITDVP